MPRNGRRRDRTYDIETIEERFRITTGLVLNNLIKSDDLTEEVFPSSLTANERAYLHEKAAELGLSSKSRGKGSNRYLTIFKREGSTICRQDPTFTLGPDALESIYSLLTRFPLSSREKRDLTPLNEQERERSTGKSCETVKPVGRISGSSLQIPRVGTSAALLPFREALPLWPLREEIVDQIEKGRVTILSGQTGSGKTTQVPQFLLDHYSATKQRCHIICSQPRRISAVAVAERVAGERNESVGKSVGYQVRLECRLSLHTALMYCTEGVLLRTLMAGDHCLSAVSHVIVDEVHERSRYLDFLLIALKEALTKYPHLRLVLMSATVDTDIFTAYFPQSTVLTVPGRQFEVQEFFLEEVLQQTGYMSKRMAALKADGKDQRLRQVELNGWVGARDAQPLEDGAPPMPPEQLCKLQEMEELISDAWMKGSDAAFSRLLECINRDNTLVDYQHSVTNVTALMAAACRARLADAEQLLALGADPALTAGNGFTALDWARRGQDSALIELLEACTVPSVEPPVVEGSAPAEHQQLLELYHASVRADAAIDYDLVLALLVHIHLTTPVAGAVLVFIAGYEDIVALRERIAAEPTALGDRPGYAVYTLHSNMQTADQKRVFQPSPAGARKIVLATNIAETSITIDDVVYVIDCGKVKEKSFESSSGACALRSEWISQACATQRKGRAGRTNPGVCFRLYSSARHAAMQATRTAEILRMPLHELCLHAKLLAPAVPIADYLGRAVEPPLPRVTRAAVALLKKMDALDPWEELTELGLHLLNMPVEPLLGKTLLYSVVLRCLDPVLTIVSCLAYKDPFVLPSAPGQRAASQRGRQRLGGGCFSDHLALLRAFQGWQAARAAGRERAFCDEHLLSSSTLEMVLGIRSQLLGQLRAGGFVRPRGHADIREANVNSENWAVVKAALVAGMYPNLLLVDREHSQLRTEKESRVMLHPSSTLRDAARGASTSLAASNRATVDSLPADWLVFDELSRSGRFCHARGCTLVSAVTVALLAGPARMSSAAQAEAQVCAPGDAIEGEDSDSEAEEVALTERASLRLDDWLLFRLNPVAATVALQLRHKWNALLLRRLATPSKPCSEMDEAVLDALVSVLTLAERELGMRDPAGVGVRPGGRHRARPASNNAAIIMGSGGSQGSGFVASSYATVRVEDPRRLHQSESTWEFLMTHRQQLARLAAQDKVFIVFASPDGCILHGLARLPTQPTERDVAPPASPWRETRPMTVHWLARGDVPLRYPMRLGAEPPGAVALLPTEVGEKLCQLWAAPSNARHQNHGHSHGHGHGHGNHGHNHGPGPRSLRGRRM